MNDRHQTLIREYQRTPSRINTRTTAGKHVPFKLQKTKGKEKILKRSQRKETPYILRNRLRITSDFWSEIMQARRNWSEIFKVLKEKT